MHRAHLPAVLCCLAAALLLAGCVSDDDPTPADDDGTPVSGSDGDTTGGEGESTPPAPSASDLPGTDPAATPCMPAVADTLAWAYDPMSIPDPTTFDPASGDPTQALAVRGSATFEVGAGVTRLLLNATSGDYVSLGWTLGLDDPAAFTAWQFTGDAGADLGSVTGDGGQAATGEIVAPAPGTWTLHWTVIGYLGAANVVVQAETCG